jgi:hypothetical protein
MMLRTAGAVAAGLVAWMVVATTCNLVLRAAIPGYAEVEAAMTFTMTMMLLRLLLGALSSFCAGLAAAWVARSNGIAVKLLAGVLLVVFLPVHYTLWERFPIWYHLTFLLSLVVATMLGAMCYSRCARSSGERAGSSDRAGPNSAA